MTLTIQAEMDKTLVPHHDPNNHLAKIVDGAVIEKLHPTFPSQGKH